MPSAFRFDDAVLPFTRIKISTSRKDAILAKPTAFGIDFTETLSDGSIYGVAHNKNANVYLEFLLTKDKSAELYSVYHGEVLYKPYDQQNQSFLAWTDFLDADVAVTFPYAAQTGKNREALVKILTRMNLASAVLSFEKLDLKGKPFVIDSVQLGAAKKTFYPVLGIKNHYSPWYISPTESKDSVRRRKVGGVGGVEFLWISASRRRARLWCIAVPMVRQLD